MKVKVNTTMKIEVTHISGQKKIIISTRIKHIVSYC